MGFAFPHSGQRFCCASRVVFSRMTSLTRVISLASMVSSRESLPGLLSWVEMIRVNPLSRLSWTSTTLPISDADASYTSFPISSEVLLLNNFQFTSALSRTSRRRLRLIGSCCCNKCITLIWSGLTVEAQVGRVRVDLALVQLAELVVEPRNA